MHPLKCNILMQSTKGYTPKYLNPRAAPFLGLVPSFIGSPLSSINQKQDEFQTHIRFRVEFGVCQALNIS